MIPNDFGIIRQKNRDLMALFFPPANNLEDCKIEIIEPVFIEGKGLTGNGAEFAKSGNAYTVVDVSKYDYVIFYTVTNETGGRLSGFRSSESSGTINGNASLLSVPTADGDLRTTYSITNVPEDRPFVCINTLVDYKLPIIGIILETD